MDIELFDQMMMMVYILQFVVGLEFVLVDIEVGLVGMELVEMELVGMELAGMAFVEMELVGMAFEGMALVVGMALA